MPGPRRSPSPHSGTGVVPPMRRALVLGYVAALAALPVAAGAGWLAAGSAGTWGAVLGVAVPVGFLSVTAVVALVTARMGPTMLGVAVLGSWLLKIALLVAVLAALRGATFFSRGTFFAAFAVATVGYLLLEAFAVVRTRVPYVEPARQPTGDRDRAA